MCLPQTAAATCFQTSCASNTVLRTVEVGCQISTLSVVRFTDSILFSACPIDELVAFVIRCLLITHHSLLITFLIASATSVVSGVFGIQSVIPALRERVLISLINSVAANTTIGIFLRYRCECASRASFKPSPSRHSRSTSNKSYGIELLRKRTAVPRSAQVTS